MLFRKLELNWRYGLGELVIVVAGVMIALAADKWIQDQSDRRLENHYLEELATDLRSDTAELRNTLKLAAQRAELGHDLLRAMAGDTLVASTYLATAVERVMYLSYPAYSRTTMSELTSTGDLRLLRDQRLKRTLSEYYQAIDRIDQWSGNWRRIQMDLEYYLPELLNLSHREALISTGAPTEGMGSYTPAAGGDALPWAPEFSVTVEEGRQILARLRATPVIQARIEGMVRIQGSQYSFLRQLLVKATETLRALEQAVE